MNSKTARTAKRLKPKAPRCIVIAGPNGAGKTTLARELLPHEIKVERFLNADLIAAGLSPFNPAFAALQAGRLFLSEFDRLTEAKTDFAFETTLSGTGHAPRLQRLKERGYEITIIFISLRSVRLAQRRVALRVRQGGHNVPVQDIARRFERGLRNFEDLYRPISSSWVHYDNSEEKCRLQGSKKSALAQEVAPALRRAAKQARKNARMHGTPIALERNGKVISLKP